MQGAGILLLFCTANIYRNPPRKTSDENGKFRPMFVSCDCGLVPGFTGLGMRGSWRVSVPSSLLANTRLQYPTYLLGTL